MTRTARVAWRESLVARLLALTLLVVTVAVAATAWLVAHTTTRAISRQEAGSLAAQGHVYNALLAYAVTHRDWQAVEPLLASLSGAVGERVALTTTSHGAVGESGPLPASGQGNLIGVIDPLHVTSATDPAGVVGGVDARVAGPYQLTAHEQHLVRAAASRQLTCLKKVNLPARQQTLAGGRVVVELSRNDLPTASPTCQQVFRIPFPLGTERQPVRELADAIASCAATGRGSFRIAAGFTVSPTSTAPPTVTGSLLQRCLLTARRAQLRPYVAPRVLLYLGVDRTGRSSVVLSRANVERVVAVAAAVLAVVIAATVFLGGRLVRPLRQLAAATLSGSIGSGIDAAGTTNRRRDEIAVLAQAIQTEIRRRNELEDMRRAMVSDVAHELRSPLTTMRSWLEAAESGIATLDSEFLQLMLGETLLLQRIIDDLRDLAAAEAGTLRIHREIVDVDGLAQQVVDSKQGRARSGGIALRVVAPGPVRAHVDPLRVRQIVGNLLDNAVTHTPAGGQVEVVVGRDEQTMTVEVVDSGVGIAREQLPHVFERFWRGDESRSRRTGGSGLGLPLVRQLARAHGGDAEVESTRNAGTTVRVWIPDGPAST